MESLTCSTGIYQHIGVVCRGSRKWICVLRVFLRDVMDALSCREQTSTSVVAAGGCCYLSRGIESGPAVMKWELL